MTCRDCKFVRTSEIVEEGTQAPLGHCWRYPPRAIAVNQSAFPLVKLDFVCGEFKPAKPDRPARRR